MLNCKTSPWYKRYGFIKYDHRPQDADFKVRNTSTNTWVKRMPCVVCYNSALSYLGVLLNGRALRSHQAALKERNMAVSGERTFFTISN